MPKPTGGSTRAPRPSRASAILTALTSRVVRGRLLSFLPATFKGIVRLDGSIAAVTLPAGEWVSTATMQTNDKVAVLLFNEADPDDGIILGPYGDVGAGAADLLTDTHGDVLSDSNGDVLFG